MNYCMYGGVVCVMLGIGQTYLTQVIAVLYPAFMSFIALESDTAGDDKQWLTYWVVYGVFNILDQFVGFILAFIPFYYFLKLAFLLWCMHPATQGATIVYDTYILPYYNEYEGQINEIERKATDKLKET
jgi:receptor expression-enhancing protein 5/6